ncbi:mitochondrial carrier [Acaromyces ingoldii]|uniref:Mitochondrial carrier n=1 Tax=Acaromyces ingoldii TaxID=215250 RepID=A0A316YW40_9BASI|nr:mitochondrial carrier [Acaromyces ingoldii]PWN92263.1 mitochondrial carrier [Acaromyces ingoldii]
MSYEVAGWLRPPPEATRATRQRHRHVAAGVPSRPALLALSPLEGAGESERGPPPFQLSRASKDIAFGSIAGMVSKVFEHPFDLVKVRLQTQSAEEPMYRGAFDCFRQTYLKEGARGLFRGLSMPIFGATLENATLFFTYNFVQGQLRHASGMSVPRSSDDQQASGGGGGGGGASTSSLDADAENPLPMSYLAVAAAAAGSATSLVLTPVELIKCKMQVQMVARELEVVAAASAAAASSSTASSSLASPSATVSATAPGQALSSASFRGLDGPVSLFMRTIRADGLRGLWLGQTGTLLRETGGGIAWFLGFEWACRTLITRKRKLWGRNGVTKKDLTSLELIGAGALAGISYNVVLFPADSVKSTMQTEQELRGHQPGFKRSGFFQTFRHIYATRGLRGLYAGCAVTCMRSAPSSALIFLMYNKLEALADKHGI